VEEKTGNEKRVSYLFMFGVMPNAWDLAELKLAINKCKNDTALQNSNYVHFIICDPVCILPGQR
jgi:hypothetical protein